MAKKVSHTLNTYIRDKDTKLFMKGVFHREWVERKDDATKFNGIRKILIPLARIASGKNTEMHYHMSMTMTIGLLDVLLGKKE